MRCRFVIDGAADLGRKLWPFRNKRDKAPVYRRPASKEQVDELETLANHTRRLTGEPTGSIVEGRPEALGVLGIPARPGLTPSRIPTPRQHAASRFDNLVAVAKQGSISSIVGSKSIEAHFNASTTPEPKARDPAEDHEDAERYISSSLKALEETLETLFNLSWSLAEIPADPASTQTVQSRGLTDAACKRQMQEVEQGLSRRLARVQASYDLLNARYLQLQHRLDESQSVRQEADCVKIQGASEIPLVILDGCSQSGVLNREKGLESAKLSRHRHQRSPGDETRKGPHGDVQKVAWYQPDPNVPLLLESQISNLERRTIELSEDNKQLRYELDQAKTATAKLVTEHEKLGRKYKAVDAKAVIFARQRDALSREVDRLEWQLGCNPVKPPTTNEAPAHPIELTPPPDQSWSYDPLPSNKRCRKVEAQQAPGRGHHKMTAVPGWPAPRDITPFKRPEIYDVAHQIFDVRNLALDRKLKSGAQGTVAVVRSRIDRRRYVQKDQLLNPDNVYGGSLVPREKHFQEVLGRHPNIVELVYHRIYPPRAEAAYASALMYFGYCEGGDLASLVHYLNANNLYLAPVVVMQIMAEIGAAIAHMHGFRETSNGLSWSEVAIVHRDIKPDNIFIHFPASGDENSKVDDDDDVARPRFVLGDLGLATPESQCHGLAGTPGFEQPELRSAWARINNLKETDSEYRSVLAQCVIGRYSDIWCFGATLFVLMTGCRPYTCSVVHMDDGVQAIARGNETLRNVSYSDTLWQVVDSLLEPDVACRFPSSDLPQLVNAAKEIVAVEWNTHCEQQRDSDCRLLSLGVPCLG